MRKITRALSAAALFVILVFLTACAGQEPVQDAAAAAAPTPTLIAVGGSLTKPVPFGYDIILDEMVIRLSQLVRPGDDLIRAGGEDNPLPGQGQEYLLLQITNQCIRMGQDQCYVSSFDFQILDAAGNGLHPLDNLSGVEGLYSYKEFANGSSNRGFLVFLVDQAGEYQTLAYKAFHGETVYLSLVQ